MLVLLDISSQLLQTIYSDGKDISQVMYSSAI